LTLALALEWAGGYALIACLVAFLWVRFLSGEADWRVVLIALLWPLSLPLALLVYLVALCAELGE
jgi:hypothetical protein